MRDVIGCIKKYLEAIQTEKFIFHGKKLASRLIMGISEGYIKGEHEPDIVKLIEYIINNVDQFETKDKKFSIITKSIFIHGHRSQVEFKFYNKPTQRELGDIIFILSVVYNNRKYFEKMTINQFKKSNKASWKLSEESTREQLYLLSRFPIFRGANKSLIPKKEFKLPNYSKCLGTHGLLYYPGDFLVVSSNLLEIISSGRKRLNLRDLLLCYKIPYFHIIDSLYIRELLDILNIFKYFRYQPFMWNLPLLGNSCIAYNSYEFSDKYLRGLIGEMIYAKKMLYNYSAFEFLQDFLMSVKRKAIKMKLTRIEEFINYFHRFRYYDVPAYEGHYEFDYDGGGIGIIHTTINLGEGE